MKLFNLFSVLLMLTLLTGCFEDGFDQSDEPEKPTITYDATTIETAFYTAGNSGAPNIDWNGDQGSLSLNSSVDGLDINTTTGVLNWSKLLKPGSQDIQVIASNSAGQTVVNMTLINQLQGVFTGTYDDFFPYEMEFNEDGVLIVRADGLTATGTWSLEGSNIITEYTYDDFPDYQYATVGTLEITSSEATYSGNYFDTFDPLPENEVGIFEVALQ